VELVNYQGQRSTSCVVCARQRTTEGRKFYYGYADICPDQYHRARLLDRIAAIISRCHNTKAKSYVSYGGRGINVYAPWRAANGPGRVAPGRADFLQYLLTLDGWDDPFLEIDRIDNDRGYEPGNLRFVTKSENAGNKRRADAQSYRIIDLEKRIQILEEENARLRRGGLRAA
jgi:hypothetical protein